MPENQNIEWKSSWDDEYLKWVCGYANAQGGALYIGSGANVKIYDCIFINNRNAPVTGSSFQGHGGAIKNDGGTLYIENSVFDNNRALREKGLFFIVLRHYPVAAFEKFFHLFKTFPV